MAKMVTKQMPLTSNKLTPAPKTGDITLSKTATPRSLAMSTSSQRIRSSTGEKKSFIETGVLYLF